jgi:hypothetical protein
MTLNYLKTEGDASFRNVVYVCMNYTSECFGIRIKL